MQGRDHVSAVDFDALKKSAQEIDFFSSLRTELKKASEFFDESLKLYQIRQRRVASFYQKLLNEGSKYDPNMWSRLLKACVKLYKEILLLENFAIMNYCGVSKILKKHDKQTGFSTRELFMRNVMSFQNFTRYPALLNLLKESERLFADIQRMDSVMPLLDEERLFIDAIRDLNFQASKLQAEENEHTASISPFNVDDAVTTATNIARFVENSSFDLTQSNLAFSWISAVSEKSLDNDGEMIDPQTKRVRF